MGWDAFSSAEKDWEKNQLIDPEIDELFKEAVAYVRDRTESVDCLLRIASLDCSACARMLEQATGKDVWDDNGWDEKSVKKVNENANWNFEYDPDLAWAYWSAKVFLETCAKANLSIEFSY